MSRFFLAALFFGLPSFASTLIECEVEVGILGFQSAVEINTATNGFFRLAEIGGNKILTTKPGSHQKCEDFDRIKSRMGARFPAVLESQDLRKLRAFKAGMQVKLIYRYIDSRTVPPYDLYMSESWVLE